MTKKYIPDEAVKKAFPEMFDDEPKATPKEPHLNGEAPPPLVEAPPRVKLKVNEETGRLEGTNVFIYERSLNRHKTLKARLDILKIKYRYNTFAHRTEINFQDFITLELGQHKSIKKLPETEAWIELTTDLRNEIILILETHTGFIKTHQGVSTLVQPQIKTLTFIDDFLPALAKRFNHIDPCLKWLEGMYNKHKDKISSIEKAEECIKNAVDKCFDFENLEQATLGFTALLTNCVRRQYKPGAKADISLFIHGDPGIGKSTFLDKLFDEGVDYFAEDMTFLADKKETNMQFTGKIMVDFTEFKGVLRRDIDSFKSFLSTRNDEVRVLYKGYVRRPRRFVITATTNHPTPIPNDVGCKRRCFFVQTKKKKETSSDCYKNICDFMDNQGGRELLWASAVTLYKNGWLTTAKSQEIEDTAIMTSDNHISTNTDAVEVFVDYLKKIEQDPDPAGEKKLYKKDTRIKFKELLEKAKIKYRFEPEITEWMLKGFKDANWVEKSPKGETRYWTPIQDDSGDSVPF